MKRLLLLWMLSVYVLVSWHSSHHQESAVCGPAVLERVRSGCNVSTSDVCVYEGCFSRKAVFTPLGERLGNGQPLRVRITARGAAPYMLETPGSIYCLFKHDFLKGATV